ncbi:hypothetical protein GCM10010965_08400 [Caldalkalibacillus thermarum]|uniref:hypothetical protein n=1 Tax=Caldalkalibacillus thermarum TaxID=296745 RepID=UPI0016681EDF|nr:hypothetical protein [Caldalkalibacillus thermarum]GGK17724.1 hypothetical protein GCM10010965_08400 [Caldalkalibacillus thermarum]
MDFRVEEIHKRNVLLVKILWIALIFSLVVVLMTESAAFTTLLVGGVMSGVLLHMLTWKRIGTVYIPYLFVIVLTLLNVALFMSVLNLRMFLIIYFILALVSLYHDYRPLLFMGVAGD